MLDNVLVLASVASMIDQFNIPNIKLLIEMGFHVDVACNFLNGSTCSDEKISQLKTKLNDMGVGIYQIDFARNAFNVKRNLKAFHQVLGLVKINRYGFIHCHSPIGGLCGRLAGHMTHTKVIYTAHGFHFYEGAPLLNWLVYYPIEKFLSRYTDVLITINKEDFARAKTFHAKKVEYIPGVGIDIDKIQAVTVDRTEKRKKLGIPENAFLLISVGELNKNKNHETVIRALSMLSVNENVRYIIAGTGALHVYLQSLIDELGLISKVHLLGYRTDVIELLKISDCFVFPSKREGLGLATLESMAVGLPLISTYIGGIRDYTNNSTGCCITDPLDAKAMKEAIQKILDDSAFRASCAKNNKKIVAKFNLKISLNTTKQIYLNTLRKIVEKA